LIWHLHDMLTADHFAPLMRLAATRLANLGAARVIANSHATAQAFAEAGGDRSKVRVVHNGIDPEPFDRVDETTTRAGLRRILDCGTAPLLGVFGRLATWKGQHVLIEALQGLPDVHAVLVGGPLFGEGDYDSWLHRMVSERGLTGRVHFLGFREDVPALMKGVDIVLHTSVTPEPFGRVIVEGMLAGKPVIATAAGGVLEILEPAVSGLVVPPGDAAALASAIRELLASPARAAALARRGCAEARRRFSLEAHVDAIDAVIAELNVTAV
jgi:glycosyltransferase involved in cell wall biosynthesis